MILSGREISAEIIECCQRGDRDAFRALYEVYKDKVYSMALYFFHGDSAAAGDATQQVFLRLMTNIAKFRGESDFATWLYRLVVNVCLDGARRDTGHRMASEMQMATLAGPDSPEEDVARDEVGTAVRVAISSLPPKLRLPVLLRYFDDLSYGQMAEALSCSIGTVASRLSRSHRMLAEKLGALRGSDAGK
jgi:RNA polymerase sigma-70 factor (ECF subfamily)